MTEKLGCLSYGVGDLCFKGGDGELPTSIGSHGLVWTSVLSRALREQRTDKYMSFSCFVSLFRSWSVSRLWRVCEKGPNTHWTVTKRWHSFC